MKSIQKPKSDSIFKPTTFINNFAPHLAMVQLPSFGILSLIPHLDRYLHSQPDHTLPYIFNTKYHLFNQPINHVLIYAGMGAPVASMSLEIAIELGVERIFIIGTCGILNPIIQSGDIIIPTGFICNEGTSSHYRSSDESFEKDNHVNQNLYDTLRKHQIPCYQGLHWTTDAPFRETQDKIVQYNKMDCLSVDMESSALFAIAQFYQKKIAALLIGSDHLSENGWDPPQPSFRVVADRIKQVLSLIPHLIMEI
ncbi:nucleoside phosphorylase [bacterium]